MANRLDASKALHYPGQEYPFSADVEIEEMEFVGDPIAFRPVKMEGVIVGTGEQVNVRAEIESVLYTRCSRCLEEVRKDISTQIDVVFAREENPDDPDLYCFEGSTLDLTDAVRDALVMEVPLRILCKEDCKGLCPVCGTNRNLGTCTCLQGGEVTNPFAALKQIVLNDEEV